MLDSVALDPAAIPEFAYGASSGNYLGELDCRLLFLGEHHRDLLPAFEEMAGWFRAFASDDDVRRKLESTPRVARFYEAATSAGPLRVQLRDTVFFEPGPTRGLDIELRIAARGTTVSRPITLPRLAALGTLLPRLVRPTPASDLTLGMTSEDAHWASNLVEELRHKGLLRAARTLPPVRAAEVEAAVTFLGHSSLLVRTASSAVLVDPFLPGKFGQPRAVLDCARIAVDAIFLSHSHWDHCHLQTLALMDKCIPVHVPALRRPSVFNPPIASALRLLGFSDVREARHWESVSCGDIEVVPTPFFGEADEPGEEIDHFTYVIRAGGKALFGGVDCYSDAFGDMRDVLKEVRERYQPELAFLPISRMTYPWGGGGVNGFCRRFDRGLLDATFQYTADPALAAEWLATLQSRWLVPYATFSLGRREPPSNFAEIKRELARAGLSGRLYPMLPLDRLELRQVGSESMRVRQLAACNAWAAAGAMVGAAKAARRRMRGLARPAARH